MRLNHPPAALIVDLDSRRLTKASIYSATTTKFAPAAFTIRVKAIGARYSGCSVLLYPRVHVM